MIASLRTTLLLAAVLTSMGASYRSQTTNFLVDAPTPQIAQQVAQYAEHYRKEKAREWLGREMPNWRTPCPLRVTVTMDGAGGATTFEYGNGEVMHQHMHIEGSLDRLLASVLPHEVTHTVFAHHFRTPVPRWADEGGSVLSEDEIERNRHDQLTRQILNTPGRAMPLRRLFALREYPHDVMTLYAQGYSVTNFLVTARGRGTFLNFVAHGMRQGWDAAVQTYYGYRNIEELERAWVENIRTTRRAPTQLAKNTENRDNPTSGRLVVRQTMPAVQLAFDPQRPVVRAQSPESDGEARQPRSQPERTPRRGAPADYPVREGTPRPGVVTLGIPEPSPPGVGLGRPVPAGASPVGFPR